MSPAELRALPRVYLHPGEYFSGFDHVVVSTILGSCIAITFFHPGRSWAAMCHALLPIQPGHLRNLSAEDCTRYVDCALARMLSDADAQRVPRRELVVKLFGGANMFRPAPHTAPVGQKNTEAAVRHLQEAGLRITISDVLGDRGRRLLFHTATGDIYLRRMPPPESEP
ncbi:MAG: chemotaxis protein CheD [Magnetococcus sp. WYHC-3]